MEQAIAAFRNSESLAPLSEQDRFTFAMALIQQGSVDDAIGQLTVLNRQYPNQALYLYWLAKLDYDQRLYESAVQRLRRVVELDPNFVRGYDSLGLCFDMMGMPEQAEEAFTKAVALNRKLSAPSPWPPHNFGTLLLRLQRFPDAEKNLRESLKYDPRFAMAHYHLGRVLESEGAADAAIDEYQAAAELDQKFAEPLYSLGLLYRRNGRITEANTALAEYKKRKAVTR
jgi:superkiller protein 3